MKADVIRIPLRAGRQPPRSLDFDGDDVLVDWCGGGERFFFDGRGERAKVFFAYSFDATAVSRTREHIVLYTRLGTKGLLINRAPLQRREIDRSYYFASAYEYPVALVRAPDERDLLVHCPKEYNRLEIEPLDGAPGASNAPTQRKPRDFFHSRLAPNPSGTRLMSAGWIWHPFDGVVVFDLLRALNDPAEFDQGDVGLTGSAEVTAAAWRDDDTLFVWCAADGNDFEDDEPHEDDPKRFRPGTIATYDVVRQEFLTVAPLAAPAGRLMPVGPDHVVGFHGHPRLIHVPSGQVIAEWPHIACGVHGSSIIHHLPAAPATAFDPAAGRFAVAANDAIHVVRLDVASAVS
jgi:hypothetical protein